MIRLRNPEVSLIKAEALRYIRALGYDEPLPLYRRGIGEQYFATQDFANAMKLILDSPTAEGVDSSQELAGVGPQTVRENKQSVDTHSLPPALDGADSGETQTALRHDFLTRKVLTLAE